MPWTKTNYPVSMKNLPEDVREKAIEIANALLKEKNMEEGILIATAISRAKDWAANRGRETESKKQQSRSVDVKMHGKDHYVIPYGEREWAVKEEGKKQVQYIFRNKRDAIKLASTEAKRANSGVTIQKRTGKIERKISFNPRRRAGKNPTVAGKN